MDIIKEVYVRSDLYVAGVTEDGEDYVGEIFYVVIEKADGRRFRSPAEYPGVEVVYADDGPERFFKDVRKEAEAAAMEEVDWLREWTGWADALPRDMIEIDPVYGSDIITFRPIAREGI